MKMKYHSKNKVMSVEDAVKLIKDDDTVTTGGFCGAGVAEEIVLQIEKHYLETRSPRNITLVYCAGQGDFAHRGMGHLGHEGLVGRIISGYYGASPDLTRFVIDNKIPGHNLPQGVLSQMFRDIAARKPRTITTVGLKTFVDPRLEGGRVNTVPAESLVDLIEFDGKEYLAYKTFPIDVAILRGTTADEDGNITMEREALTLESQAQAMAVKSSGGIVMVQVERVAQRGTLDPKLVVIPGVLVDAVVVADQAHHWQTFAEVYNPAFSGETKVPMATVPRLPMSPRKIIARRAAFELQPGDTVNLGIGMPEGIANVANEEGVLETVTLTAEPGIIGGMPASKLNFGAAYNPQAIISQPAQFDFYHGGGLDVAFLGLAQVDRFGNLNVSKFGPRLAGAGGFIDITQNAKKVVFVGTFTAGGIDVAIQDGKLSIQQEGRSMKFIQDVEQVTFSGEYAAERNQPVLYVTERCVFELSPNGLKLIEVAPGIDVEKDILGQMAFQPIVEDDVKLMDDRIFRDAPMELGT
jgi:propionate CoA-transferase